MEILQYGSLRIRQAQPRDAAQLAAWWNDGELMIHVGFPNGLGTTEEEVRAKLRPGLLIIEEAGRPVGECNYRSAGEGVVDVGIKICERDCQGRGLGRIAMSMLIRWLFDQGNTKITLDTALSNLRAQHVYESLGFQKLRINRNSWTDQLGQLRSSVDYELTKDTFVDFTA